MNNYWKYKIKGNDRNVFGTCVVETNAEAVRRELDAEGSLLRRELSQFFKGTDPEAFCQDQPLDAEELFGRLVARERFVWRQSAHGLWTPLEQPKGERVAGPPEGQQPVLTSRGIRLWLVP